MKEKRYKDGLLVIDKATFDSNPKRFELRVEDPMAPLCPYGNMRSYIGYDKEDNSYVRFTKSVFKSLI